MPFSGRPVPREIIEDNNFKSNFPANDNLTIS